MFTIDSVCPKFTEIFENFDISYISKRLRKKEKAYNKT